jgi:hypothetical protein
MNKRFKYQDQLIAISEFRGCNFPPDNLHIPAFEEDVYRFIFDNPEHPNNHKPPFIIKPLRANNPNDKMKSDGYALSCFEKEIQAKRTFQKFTKSNRNFAKTAGNSLSRGLIENIDGLVDNTTESGHFNLYEFEDCDLSQKFVITETLVQ